MNQETSLQGGNSHPDHVLGYVAELTRDRQFRVECGVCTHYIRLTLGRFFELQQSRQTYSFFLAMVGECTTQRDPLIAGIALILEGIRQEPDQGKAQGQMDALKRILKGASQ